MRPIIVLDLLLSLKNIAGKELELSFIKSWPLLSISHCDQICNSLKWEKAYGKNLNMKGWLNGLIQLPTEEEFMNGVNNYSMLCPFCQIVAEKSKRILRESPATITVLSDPRLMPGHLLVIPKRHVQKLSELADGERAELMNETILAEERLLTKFPGCDISQHFRPFIPDNGLKVSHLHIHVRPRSLDDELYLKVQKFEHDVFAAASDAEEDEYRELLK